VRFLLCSALLLAACVLSNSEARSAATEPPSATFVETLSTSEIAGLFPPAAHTNVLQNWPIVQAALKNAGLGSSRNLVIYAIATIRVETGTFSPMDERPSTYSKTTDRASTMGIEDAGAARPYGAYDSTLRTDKGGKVHVNKDLGNQYYRGKDDELLRAIHGDPPITDQNEGEKFRGRGFIQLTGRANYQRIQDELKSTLPVNLVENPDAAGKVEVAAQILAGVVADHRTAIEQLMGTGQYLQARKITNAAGLGMPEFLAVVHHFHPLQR
jgi:predicted chitinase